MAIEKVENAINMQSIFNYFIVTFNFSFLIHFISLQMHGYNDAPMKKYNY